MPSNAVPGFAPSRNGFHFANRWPATPALWFEAGPVRVGVGNAADGLCGGMVFAARDRFEREEPPPADPTAPDAGSDLFREIVRRQVDSFDHLVRVPLRFYALATLHPDGPTWWSRPLGLAPRGTVAIRDEWPRVRADIDSGHLSMLGLIRSASANPLRLGHNHQVLAYAYDVSASLLRLRLYDPNWPDRDDVEIVIRLVDRSTAALEQSTGEPLFGFFRAPYRAP